MPAKYDQIYLHTYIRKYQVLYLRRIGCSVKENGTTSTLNIKISSLDVSH